MNMHEIGYMIRFDPEKAKKTILEALRLERMHKGHAAQRLGCRHGTLLRWIATLKLAPAIERMNRAAVKEGWFHGNVGGRPKGKSRTSAGDTR